MKYLIVNADDLGMTKGINEGIIKAKREGIVTDVSMLAAGRAFDDAVKLARANGITSVGAHLSVTELGTLTLRKRIYSRNAFLLKFISGGILRDEVRLEFARQLDKIREAGFEITHIDSHEHLHMLTGMLRIFGELAREYRIPAIRFLRNDRLAGSLTPAKLYRYSVMRYFADRDTPIFQGSGLYYPDRVFGFLDSGRLTEEVVLGMLDSLGEGVTELVCHPGFLSPEVLDDYKSHINCEEELLAVTSQRVTRLIEREKIQLVSYKDAISKK